MNKLKSNPREYFSKCFDLSCPLIDQRINEDNIYLCKYRPSIKEDKKNEGLAALILLPCDCSDYTNCPTYELTQNDM